MKKIIVVFILFLTFYLPNSLANNWYFIGQGKPLGVSGIALLSNKDGVASFIVVHDNKFDTKPRLAIVNIDKNGKSYYPLSWPNNYNLPQDLEAITTVVDDTSNSFIAMESSGKCYHVSIDTNNKKIILKRIFVLPNFKKENLEGFTLKKIDNVCLGIWASRGDNDKPSNVYYGIFDFKKYKFTKVKFFSILSPWPTCPEYSSGRQSYVRHIADIRLDEDNNLYISSTSEPKDLANNQYQSAVYAIGKFVLKDKDIEFHKKAHFIRLYRFQKCRVEGIEFITKNEIILGIDNDDKGGWVFVPKN